MTRHWNGFSASTGTKISQPLSASPLTSSWR